MSSAPVQVDSSSPSEPSALAAFLRLSSAGLALVAAVLLVLPEAAQVGTRATVRAELPSRPETTLTPVFDTPMPAPVRVPGKAADPGPFVERSSRLQEGTVLIVDTEPAEASVVVDGQAQGTTPVSMTLDCAQHAGPIQVEVRLRGYALATYALDCKDRTMTKLTARLRRSRSRGP